MEGKMKPYFCLEDILFKYERQEAQIDLLQVLISDGVVNVVGAPENSVEYALYEICVRMQEINQELREFIRSRALPDVVENGREVYSATKEERLREDIVKMLDKLNADELKGVDIFLYTLYGSAADCQNK